jgi:hypothetical protein
MAAGTRPFGGYAAGWSPTQYHHLQRCLQPYEKGEQEQRALGLLTVVRLCGLVGGLIVYSAAISACEMGQQSALMPNVVLRVFLGMLFQDGLIGSAWGP